MNILLHIGVTYPDGEPCVKRMQVFASVFRRHGHSVTILANKSLVSAFDTVPLIPCPVIPLRKKTTFKRLLNHLSFAFSSFFLSFTVRKVDVVITTSPPPLISVSGWLIAKIKRACLVYDVRDIWPDVAFEMGSFRKGSLYGNIFALIRDFMLTHANFVTTVSHGKVEKLQGYCPMANVIEIANGLDEEFLNFADDSAIVTEYDLDSGFICSYIGNLGLAQGITQLLCIAQRAQCLQIPVRFLLFGSGADENRLKVFVEEHHLTNVYFAGRISNQAVYTVLCHSNISFISLVNENLTDSIPTKLYEALGAGCSVLLAACGDSVKILNECRLGIAARPNDEEALWDAFCALYHDNAKIKENGAYSQKVILEKYSRQQAAEILETKLVAFLAMQKSKNMHED